MCGIVGWVDYKSAIDEQKITQMRDTLTHRGPDDAGNYFSHDKKIALAHRRLSFLDLSMAGHQPMCNETERIWIVLNGEIYNYKELALELSAKGHVFKSSSDTEVLLHGYEEWGIDKLLQKIKGMFAFALLDENQQQLFLIRDRFGIKPLYYYASGERFIFGSELKAIIKSGAVEKEINYSSFADYFVYRYIPSPKTIWKNIAKLQPAHYIKLNIQNGVYELTEYWKLGSEKKQQSTKQLVQEIGSMIGNSVSEHSRSDVEIGSFLSGGYDSSAIVYYLSKIKTRVKNFSIGFENWDASEHQYAAMVSEKLNGVNTSLIAGKESLNILKKLSTVYDEPIADISIIPTYLVSQLASFQIKSVMSGEGADELFGGYEWQKQYYKKWRPENFSAKLKNIFLNRSENAVNEYSQAMEMGKFDCLILYQLLNPELHQFIPDDTDWFYRSHYKPQFSPLKSFQYLDIKCFMAELVLTKVDRASMAHSLEVRVPFLDHELFQKIFELDESVYFKPGITKFLLHENIKNVLPPQIINRKKQGFVGPDSYYMNMDWYKEIIYNGKLLSEQVISKTFVDTLFENKDHWRLWKIAVMENWFNEWN